MSGPTVHSLSPNLFQLESRITPNAYYVTDAKWDAATEKTLPWAIAQANAHPGPDEIYIVVSPPPPPPNPGDPPPLPGDYLDNPTFNSTATLEVTEEVFIRGSTLLTQTVTISGVRPFRFTHTAPHSGWFDQPHQSMVAGIVFKDCTADTGGAIRIDNDNLTVTNCQFLENKATLHGGAIYVGPNATLSVDGSNTTWYPPVKGGGRSFFEKNEAALDGGAIEGAGNLFLKQAWFWDNKAGRNGGAIDLIDGSINRKDVPIAVVNPDVEFTRNKAGNDGGAIFFKTWDGVSTLTARLTWNEASGFGGAICMRDGELELTDSGVASNTGGGGGIYIRDATLTATNVSFFDNWDTVNGMPWSVVINTGGVLNTKGGCKQIGAGGIFTLLGVGTWNDDGTFSYV